MLRLHTLSRISSIVEPVSPLNLDLSMKIARIIKFVIIYIILKRKMDILFGQRELILNLKISYYAKMSTYLLLSFMYYI